MKTRLLAVFLPLAMLVGCGDAAPSPSPDATLFPQTLFVGAIEAPAVPIAEAKAGAKEGDTLVLRGVIGGRKDPFIAGRAVFTLVDPKLKPCVDDCDYPWDFCCDTQADIAANAATVQVVDSAGAVIRSDINGLRGIAPGAEVVITGTVAKRDTPATLTINATQIQVRGG